MNFCGSCGASLTVDAKFCEECGNSLKPATNKTSSNNYMADLAMTEKNFSFVGEFIQNNLFLLTMINFVIFIIMSIAPMYGWLALLLTIVTVYAYPLLTKTLQTELNGKIKKVFIEDNLAISPTTKDVHINNQASISTVGNQEVFEQLNVEIFIVATSEQVEVEPQKLNTVSQTVNYEAKVQLTENYTMPNIKKTNTSALVFSH